MTKANPEPAKTATPTPPANKIEFAKCCGTLCDKGLAMRQVKRLADLYRAIRAPLLRSYTDRVCLVYDDEKKITGVFIPIAMVDEIIK